MRCFAKILLLFYLFRAFAPEWMVEELGKIPQLAEHYYEHKAQTPELGLPAFLFMHYGEGFFDHKYAHDHSDLPLKHHTQEHHHISVAVFGTPESSISFWLNAPVRADENAANVFPEPQWFSSMSVGGIFQPPKMA